MGGTFILIDMKVPNRLKHVVKSFMVIDMKDERTHRRRTGRPLSFDRDAVLEKAMLAFWRHGYETTSLSDLTSAMGITSPSIYAAFGDKRGLFREALSRYIKAGGTTPETYIETAETARDAVQGLLEGSAVAFTGETTPTGCLLATSTISCSSGAVEVQNEVAMVRRGIEECLKRKISQAIDAGDIPSKSDAAALAGLYMAVIQGMSTLARDGASREHLLRIAASAMRAWPA